MGCLYRIEFPNGKSYIGISTRPAARRLWAHRSSKRCYAVSRALRKYGDAVQLSTLFEHNDWDVLCSLEQQAIEFFGSRAPRGYNLTEGGEGTIGRETRTDSRDKYRAVAKSAWADSRQRDKLLEGNRAAGKALSPEARARKSASMKSQHQDPVFRAKSLAARRKVYKTPEFRAAMRVVANNAWAKRRAS